MRKLTLISFTLIWMLSAQNSETDRLVEGLLGDTPIEKTYKNSVILSGDGQLGQGLIFCP